MAAATPTLEQIVTAIKTEMDAIASLGTVLTGFHGFEDDLEFIENGGYKSSGSMNLFFIDVADIQEVEGGAPGEIYERNVVEIRGWFLRTNDADWSKLARQKAESVRDKLAGNGNVFRINGQVQIITPETVQLVSHGQESIRGTEGEQLLYLTVLRLTVESRRWGAGISGGATGGDNVLLIGASASSDVLGAKVSGDAARRWNLNADGSMEWGNGTDAYDVALRRYTIGGVAGLLLGEADAVNSTGQGVWSIAKNVSFRTSMRVYDGSDVDARADLAFYRARGTAALPTTVLVGDTLGGITWDGYHAGGSWAEGAKIDAVVDGARTTYWPTTLRFKTSDATNSFVTRFAIDSKGNIDGRGGQAELATGATDGFTYLPTMAGVPSVTPTAKTGAAPVVIDRSGSKLYAYFGGSWKSATLA